MSSTLDFLKFVVVIVFLGFCLWVLKPSPDFIGGIGFGVALTLGVGIYLIHKLLSSMETEKPKEIQRFKKV